ncbi:MAG TPA: protein-tyrosine phosphatase family protein [Pseudonocardia sp.]|uniref:protein-tyrosine phosphatase family protein n=1 Tax=Pseudonocardia sp. TaxID=60912 RepID=UPI002C1800DD|nr:protein-tyrosine phosphatase family protein [Pseudonocardia sp.]HTF53320.1 protein-tyrosine phosphatase family protein [Pseudonocardia sp.]
MSEDQLVGAISLPDGTMLRGRGRREPLPSGPPPDYGLYLGRPPDSARGRLPWRGGSAWRPDWPADWIDWPDFRTPRDSEAAAALIRHAYLLARSRQRVEVACVGGIGRTGTVIACMAILAGHPADDAVNWTRRHYRPRAVETPGQRRWISWFADWRRD